MTQPQASTTSAQFARKEIAKIKDELRLKLNLASLELRSLIERIEPKLVHFEGELERKGEDTLESASEMALEIARSFRDFVTRRVPEDGVGHAPVRDAMRTLVVTCTPEESVAVAVQRMIDSDCGALPVVDAERRVVAMVTDRDIAVSALAQGTSLANIHVWSAMSRAIYTCSPDDTLAGAEGIMMEAGVRRLPVVDVNRLLVGLITLDDMATHVQARAPSGVPTAAQAEIARTLAVIAAPTGPKPPQAAAE